MTYCKLHARYACQLMSNEALTVCELGPPYLDVYKTFKKKRLRVEWGEAKLVVSVFQLKRLTADNGKRKEICVHAEKNGVLGPSRIVHVRGAEFNRVQLCTRKEGRR